MASKKGQLVTFCDVSWRKQCSRPTCRRCPGIPRARCGPRSSLLMVTDTLARRLTQHPLPQQCTRRLVHIAVPAPCCHVAKCSIFVARGPGGLLLLFHQQNPRTPPTTKHPSARSRAHPQHARTHVSATVHAIPHALLLLPSVFLVPPHAHSDSLFHAGPRTPLPLSAVVSQHAWRLSLLLQGSHPSLGRPFFLSTCAALRRAPRPVPETTCDFYSNNPNNPRKSG